MYRPTHRLPQMPLKRTKPQFEGKRYITPTPSLLRAESLDFTHLFKPKCPHLRVENKRRTVICDFFVKTGKKSLTNS